jgi:hypothetical protein
VERAVAGLVQTLRVRRRWVSHDNFFELGGDSILSIQIGVAPRSRSGG